MVSPDWEDCLLYKSTHKSKQCDLLGITMLSGSNPLRKKRKNAFLKMLLIKHICPSILREDKI